MSAGVSDQRMKGQSNQVINSSSKNVESEERTSIPWSQQVDEAYETTLASPTEGNSGCYESSSSGGTQFQYPPFNVKERDWSGKSSSRRGVSSNNYVNDGRMYGQNYGQQQQQQSYNYFSKNNSDYNSWSSQSMNSHNARRSNYDDYRSDSSSHHQNDTLKSVQRGMQNMGLESNSTRSSTTTTNDTSSSSASNATKTDTQVASVPKKMTWASIASQPAKPTLRTSSSTSTLKKKGPGMPPPPMVPGKHNMDIGTWDSPKNGPVLVPPPLPPVIPVPIMEPFPLGQSSKSSNSSSTNTGQSSIKEESTSNPITAPQQKPLGSSNNNNNNNSQSQINNQSSVAAATAAPSTNSNQHVRPPWISQNNPQQNSKNFHQQSQQHQQHSRLNINQGHHGMPSSGGPDSVRSGPDNIRSNAGYHSSHSSQPPPSHHNQPQQQIAQSQQQQQQHSRPAPVASPTLSNSSSNYHLLEELRDKNNYNPAEIDMETATVARFFIIKSYSEDDIHRSIKYEIWCSTEHGNKRLDDAFREREREGGVVYLFFSVNGSRHFCGMAQMMTPVDYNSVSSVWSQDKWKGTFKVKWIYVKDVPNTELRHIRLENNENKSVTNSRDTQEVPNLQGQEVLRILHAYEHETSIFDDFLHYEQRQELENSKKYDPNPNLRQIENIPPSMKSHPQRGGGGAGGDYERRFDRYHDGSSSCGGGGGSGSNSGGRDYRDRNYGRSGGGGYQNFDNRRMDDHRGFDRMSRDNKDDGPGHFNHNRENNGDFHNRGFHRGEYNRRDDRGGHPGGSGGGYNNRERDRDPYYDGGSSGGFMRNDNRGIGGGGGFRDNYNRDRDHYSRGRGRGGSNGGGGGGNSSSGGGGLHRN